MSEEHRDDYCPLSTTAANIRVVRLLLAGLLVAVICAAGSYAQSIDPGGEQGAAGEPYSQMPSIAPIGVRIGKYLDAPAAAKGPALDPAKGYRLQDLGGGLYLKTLTPKWSSKLAGFDVYVWDQCYAMEQSLRIE
jgi:hypothetical protein